MLGPFVFLHSTEVGNGDEALCWQLPDKKSSGLLQAMNLLGNLEEVKLIVFDEKDVMRHPLVKKIIKAYDNQK